MRNKAMRDDGDILQEVTRSSFTVHGVKVKVSHTMVVPSGGNL